MKCSLQCLIYSREGYQQPCYTIVDISTQHFVFYGSLLTVKSSRVLLGLWVLTRGHGSPLLFDTH